MNSKPKNLDRETKLAIVKCGGKNNCQARYFQELSSYVVKSEISAFEYLQPDLKIKNSRAWGQALNLVNAYLKRYKMELTLKTMKKEFANNPKTTSYKNTSIIDSTFNNLISFSKDLSKMSFEERVHKFNSQFKK